MYRDISSIAVAVQICTCDKRSREERPELSLMYAELPNYRFMLRCTTWTDIFVADNVECRTPRYAIIRW